MIGSNFVLFRSLNLGGCFIPEVGVDMGYSILLNSAVLYAAYFVRWGSLISEYAFIAIPLHELQQFLIVRSAVIVCFVQVSMSWCTEGLALMGKQLPQTSRWGLITVIASKIYDWNGNIVKSNVSPQVLAWMGRIPLKEEMTEWSWSPLTWQIGWKIISQPTDICSKMRPNLFLLLHVKYRFISVFVHWLDELEILSLGEIYKKYPSALKEQWIGMVSLLSEFNFWVIPCFTVRDNGNNCRSQ